MVKISVLLIAILISSVEMFDLLNLFINSGLQISEKCESEIVAGRINCDQILLKNLNESGVLKKLQMTYIYGPKDRINKINHQLDCCCIWETIDCIEPVVKSKCTEKEVKTMFEYLKETVENVTEERCSDLPHKSIKCSDITAEDYFDIAFDGQEFPNVSTNCGADIEEVTKNCNQTTLQIWKKSVAIKEIAEAAQNNDSHKMQIFMKIIQCCATYDMIDCMESDIKNKCNSTEYNEMHKSFEHGKLIIENALCKSNPYNSTECQKYRNKI